MEKKKLFEAMDSLEDNLKQLTTDIDKYKEAMTKLLEENAELTIENQHLRDYIQSNGEQSQSGIKSLSKSRLNLEKLYEEGFHVCNVLYGTRRSKDEECMLCIDTIYGNRKG